MVYLGGYSILQSFQGIRAVDYRTTTGLRTRTVAHMADRLYSRKTNRETVGGR